MEKTNKVSEIDYSQSIQLILDKILEAQAVFIPAFEGDKNNSRISVVQQLGL